MLTEAASVGLLLKALGYGIPAALLVFSLLITSIVIKANQAKADKDREERTIQSNRDREEHMAKWNSMIEQQEKSSKAQERSINSLLQSNKEEIDRMFQLQTRQATALEGFAFSLSRITSQLEHERICPNTKEST